VTVRIDSLAAAYSATGAAWQRGPALVYDRLAEVIVGRSRRPLHGCSVLDVGAGTGAAGRAATGAGARSVVAVDAAIGMLLVDPAPRRAVVGDALRLPFASGSFDASIAAFSLNHLTDPASGLRETVRVTRVGGSILVGSYGADDGHPVKAAVDGALAARGWAAEAWYAEVRERAIPQLATVEACRLVADAAGLDAEVEGVRVPFPHLCPPELVAWRLGMAQHAAFLAGLADDERAAVVRDALECLGDDPPPLERSIIVLHAVRG